MFLGESRAQRFAQPIRVHPAGHFLHPLIMQVVQPQLLQRIVRQVGINTRQFLKTQLLAGIHQVVVRQVGHRDREVPFITQAQPPFFRLHGLDDHHAVGRFRAINGRGSSILQDGDRSHAVHVQVGNRLQVRFKPVKDEERLVGIRAILFLQPHDAALAADFNVGHAVGV